MENPPKLTVIMATRNAAATIARALDSLATQHYPNLELIVWDGFSQDGTLDIVKQYSSLVTILRSEVDNGPPDAHNKSLALATGDYIGFLDTDDEYQPGTLWAVADALQKNPEADVVSFGMSISTYNEKGRWRIKGHYAAENQLHLTLRHVLTENPSFMLSRFYKKSVFLAVGALNTEKSLCYYASDREWMARLAIKSPRNVIIPKALYSFCLNQKKIPAAPDGYSRIITEHATIADALLARSDIDDGQRKWILRWKSRQLALGFWFSLSRIRIDEAEIFAKQGWEAGRLQFIVLGIWLFAAKSIKKLALKLSDGIDRGIMLD